MSCMIDMSDKYVDKTERAQNFSFQGVDILQNLYRQLL